MSEQYIVIPFKSEKLFYRDEFTNYDIGLSVCGSLEPCTKHAIGGRSTCLRVGNHAMYTLGCYEGWISREYTVFELAKEAIVMDPSDVEDFTIKGITVSVELEGGWADNPFDVHALIAVLVNGEVKWQYELPVPPKNQPKTYTIPLDIKLDKTDKVSVGVNEYLRAATGYVLLHAYNIKMEYAGKAFVPSAAIKKGSLELTVIDEEGNPLGDVYVEISMGSIRRSGRTDSNGYIIFQDVPYGKYRVVARKTGYKPVEVYLTVNDALASYKIVMEKSKAAFSLENVLKYAAMAAGIIGAGATVYTLVKKRGEKE